MRALLLREVLEDVGDCEFIKSQLPSLPFRVRRPCGSACGSAGANAEAMSELEKPENRALGVGPSTAYSADEQHPCRAAHGAKARRVYETNTGKERSKCCRPRGDYRSDYPIDFHRW
jgi:hypothetical protein